MGAAVIQKIRRDAGVVLSRDVAQLASYISRVADHLHAAVKSNEHILLEGTQGAGLSLPSWSISLRH